MSKKYLITLKPQGAFYFGGEYSFGTGDKTDSLASYIVESNYFPQQTSLLGMLRFWLLRNDSVAFDCSINRIINKEVAEKIIGSKSFSAKENRTFGKILKVGTCQIKKGNDEFLLPMPLDFELDVDFRKALTVSYNDIEKKMPKIQKKGTDDEYTGKNPIYSKLYSTKKQSPVEYEEVFTEDRRVGIERDHKTGKVDDGNLYKQIFYRLNEDCSFVFEAEFDDSTVLPENNQLVELGGDSSKFILSYEEIKDETKMEYGNEVKLPSGDKTKVVLLSDAFIDNDNSIFSITEITPMRFLETLVKENGKYHRLTNKEVQDKEDKLIKKSDRYSLYKRGSVFYFDEKQATAFIENNKKENFKQIGYNNFQIIK